MTQVTLRSVHPSEHKELVPFGIWLIQRVVIGAVMVVMMAPFVMHYLAG